MTTTSTKTRIHYMDANDKSHTVSVFTANLDVALAKIQREGGYVLNTWALDSRGRAIK